MMPAISDIPNTPIPLVCRSVPVSYGDLLCFPITEAIEKIQRSALKHWESTIGPSLKKEDVEHDETVELIRMPPNRTYKVKMRIVDRKRGAVAPYDVTDIN